jgi:hypothetical protein
LPALLMVMMTSWIRDRPSRTFLSWRQAAAASSAFAWLASFAGASKLAAATLAIGLAAGYTVGLGQGRRTQMISSDWSLGSTRES